MEVKSDPRSSFISHLEIIRSTLKEGKGNEEAIGVTANYDVLVHQLNVLALRLSNGDVDLSDTLSKASEAASSLVVSENVIQGRFLREEINEFADSLLERAIDYCGLAFQKPYPSESVRKLGIIWDKYDISFSSTNLEACIRILSREKDLIQDAFDELLEKDEDDSETEALARTKGSGLVKGVVVLNKKLIESLDSDSGDVDDLTGASLKLSEHVDDYVFSLYSVIDEPESVRESSKILYESAIKIIDMVSQNSLRAKDAASWGEFLRKAINHNYTQILNLLNELEIETKLTL